MKMELIIRRFAGIFVLASLLLAHYHSPYWLWVTAFVGFNLLQSSFTKFCPLEIILKKLGVSGSCCGGRSPAIRVATVMPAIRPDMKIQQRAAGLAILLTTSLFAGCRAKVDPSGLGKPSPDRRPGANRREQTTRCH